MASGLQTDLVRVLQALELQELPESLIKAVFDTGGTTLRRSGDGDGAETSDADIAETATLERLGDLDRVMTKYLHQHKAAHTRDGSEDDADTADGSLLWAFLTGEDANTQSMGDESVRAHHFAAYRALFAMLHTLINIGEGYANLAVEGKVNALQKALTASKVYLTWLQLPGGAAYGLFMPFVYRQVLDVIKKWIDAVASPETMSSVRRNAAGGSQKERTPRKKGGSRTQASQRSNHEDTDTHSGTQRRLVKSGADLLDTLVTFLGNFALSSSKESIIPTIEMAIYVQITGSTTEHSSVAATATRSQRLLEGLVNDIHGDVVQTARVIAHCYIAGICFQESAADARTATKFHKFAIEIIGLVQATLARTLRRGADQDGGEDVAEQVSAFYLGLAQNLCMNAPDRAEERQRVLGFTFQTCLAAELQDHDKVRFVRFLASYSKNVKAKNRQFAVELIGKLILEPKTWSSVSAVPEELETFVGVAPLLEILTDRSRDRVSTVRAKAIAAVSAVLTAGLKGVHDGENPDEDGSGLVVVPNADLIAASLRDILYTANADELEETELMEHLVELFRESLQDEKTFVRKAAIQALEALIVVRPTSISPAMRKDLFDVQARCTDTSLLVRVQAVKSLSSVVLKFPDDQDVQRLWNLGVLPLCVDPEASVQAAALEFVNRVIFDRITTWYNLRNNVEQRKALSTVWDLAAHLDGVMVRCIQKALRLLLKDSKVDVKRIVGAAIHAIKSCMAQLEETGEAEPQYWGFSWIILDELAHSGKLVEAAKSEQQNWSIVVECWNKLQEEELPTEFAEGSKRILRVIASLAPVIDAPDAKAIADSILASLHGFSIPLHVIAEAVLALHSICKSKAPSAEKGREISFSWGKQLLTACEVNLRACFEGEPNLVLEETMLIQKQLISIGEVALLEFSKDEEKNRESGVTLLSIATIKPLVQLFLPPEIVPNTASQASQVDDPPTTPTTGDNDATATAVTIPIPIRVCAFATLGKLCLRDQDLAKSCITMFIRELRTCDNQDIRSNILLILGDLCIRYTALVDVYISTIALSFLDKSPLIRRSALLLFSQLILQDYIKWRESLLRFFLRAVVDQDEELSNLARHVLCGPLLLKAPHLFTNKFIEMLFIFNKFEGKVNFSEPFEREGIDELALPGSAQFSKRSQLYKFLLQNMSDEQKLQISMKLCTEVLEEVSDGKLKLCDNPSEITDFGTEAILKDTFAILCSPDIKLSSAREEQDGEGDEADETANDGDGGGPSVASQLAAAKGKLLSKMSKKNFLENVVPVLIGLKHKLESKRSPLMRYLLHYIRELFKLYGQEVRDILSTDPQMAVEVEYDLRQYELQQQKQQDNPSGRVSFGGGVLITPTKNAATSSSGNRPRTPLQVLEGGQTPQLLSSGKAAARDRRRQSMPTAGTPAHPIQHRHVTSDEGKNTDGRAEAAGDGSNTMLFSPDKDTRREKWHVTAKSPVVASRKPGNRYSQQDLEDNMQRDLAAAFDSASGSSPSASPTKDTITTTLSFDNVGDDDEDEHVTLPLKKKSKKKKEKATPKNKKERKQTSSDEEEKSADPFEMKTPKAARSKRKRN